MDQDHDDKVFEVVTELFNSILDGLDAKNTVVGNTATIETILGTVIVILPPDSLE